MTPVFLGNDADVIRQLRSALSESARTPVELAQRRTYQEVTGLLLEGALDAAWLCGHPYLQHEKALALIGIPVWRGRPLYRSYVRDLVAELAGRIEGRTEVALKRAADVHWVKQVVGAMPAVRGQKPAVRA